jgi:hypothetical protein
VADEVVNLEDETPAAVAEAPPEAPPAEAGPAEVDAVEVGGQKYVPVAALIAERAEKKTLKEPPSRASYWSRKTRRCGRMRSSWPRIPS